MTMSKTTVSVNPEILVWARETAGLGHEAAVKKLGIRDARGVAAIDRLHALESGKDEPTRAMLSKMAKQYRRPLLTFYLSSPPPKGDRGADFRTVPSGYSDAYHALVDALVRDLRARQSMVRALLEDEDEAEPLPFVGSKKMSDGTSVVLQSLRELLGIEVETYYRRPNPKAAFDLLRERAGRQGVFVLLKGDLRSYHTAIDTDLFRGFTIADAVAPFIVINHRDTRSAWSFTLLHELTHLILGQSGIDSASIENDNHVERFCDAVAGEFLLPEPELRHLGISSDMELESMEARIGEFADERNLSRTMVAYNAQRANLIDRRVFEILSDKFHRQWIEQRQGQREQARSQDGGPSYYTVRRHRLGNELLALVRRMKDADAVSTSKAARILGVNATNVHNLLNPSRSP